MKKFFSFVFALVASALVLTSCETEPKVDSPLVGTWSTGRGTFAIHSPIDGSLIGTYECTTSYTFYDTGKYQYCINIIEPEPDEQGINRVRDIYTTEGTWTTEGNQLTLHKQKYGLRHDGEMTYEPKYQPSDEVIKWEIKDKNLLLTYYAGTEKEMTMEYYGQNR